METDYVNVVLGTFLIINQHTARNSVTNKEAWLMFLKLKQTIAAYLNSSSYDALYVKKELSKYFEILNIKDLGEVYYLKPSQDIEELWNVYMNLPIWFTNAIDNIDVIMMDINKEQEEKIREFRIIEQKYLLQKLALLTKLEIMRRNNTTLDNSKMLR